MLLLNGSILLVGLGTPLANADQACDVGSEPLRIVPPMPRKDAAGLSRIVAALLDQHGKIPAPPPTNAFEHVLWEKVAYLASDDVRARAFEELRTRVGLSPRAILDAKPSTLSQIVRIGGAIGVEDRVRHMQDAAAFVADTFDGSLDKALRLPRRDAMRALRKIHGVGEPGAEKILLLTRTERILALDSNGARVLVRIGYGADDRNYSAMYRSVREATTAELVPRFDWLIDAHLVLRRHGQTICKTSAPRCAECSVRAECAFAGAQARGS
jgi:endonuclease III